MAWSFYNMSAFVLSHTWFLAYFLNLVTENKTGVKQKLHVHEFPYGKN